MVATITRSDELPVKSWSASGSDLEPIEMIDNLDVVSLDIWIQAYPAAAGAITLTTAEDPLTALYSRIQVILNSVNIVDFNNAVDMMTGHSDAEKLITGKYSMPREEVYLGATSKQSVYSIHLTVPVFASFADVKKLQVRLSFGDGVIASGGSAATINDYTVFVNYGNVNGQRLYFQTVQTTPTNALTILRPPQDSLPLEQIFIHTDVSGKSRANPLAQTGRISTLTYQLGGYKFLDAVAEETLAYRTEQFLGIKFMGDFVNAVFPGGDSWFALPISSGAASSTTVAQNYVYCLSGFSRPSSIDTEYVQVQPTGNGSSDGLNSLWVFSDYTPDIAPAKQPNKTGQ